MASVGGAAELGLGLPNSVLDLVTGDAIHSAVTSAWDPLLSSDWDRERPTEQCVERFPYQIVSYSNRS